MCLDVRAALYALRMCSDGSRMLVSKDVHTWINNTGLLQKAENPSCGAAGFCAWFQLTTFSSLQSTVH